MKSSLLFSRAAVFLPGSLQAKLFSVGSAEPDMV